MNEVTIGISNPQQLSARFLNAWETKQKQNPYIGFESEELLWDTLTLKRWQILKIMTGAGEMSINEIAQHLNRDLKKVQKDIQILCHCGLLEKTNSDKFIFPYSAVHVDFMLQAA